MDVDYEMVFPELIHQLNMDIVQTRVLNTQYCKVLGIKIQEITPP